MRFMTWNIQNGGGSRVDEICRRIGESDPDVLALTESRNTNEPAIRHRLTALGYGHIVTSKPEDRQNGLLVAAKRTLQETGERVEYDGSAGCRYALPTPTSTFWPIHSRCSGQQVLR